ncbi:unnamed protein product [Arctia plantaginis]|uniref:Tetraspanin n=1 Tax=Arctia plantaginis TaxID=874455 RepID=A0A8S0Z118_ARCPL|nr:unnamed protein product [Arctia plantaginis]
MCLRFLVKYILFFVNFIFTLLGLALIGLGVAALYQFQEVFDTVLTQTNIDIHFLPYVVIGVGAFIFLVSFCGCCGAIVESKCLLITYAVINGIIAAAKIYLVVELLTQYSYIRLTVENYVDQAFDDPTLNHTFHAMEYLLQCCGTTGPESYNITFQNVSYVPPTCCGRDINIGDLINIGENEIPEGDISDLCTLEESFQVGCTATLGQLVETWTRNLGYILIVVIVVEVVALVFASYLASTIKMKY